MQGLTTLRRTTIKTLRVVACAESGESVTYSSCSEAGPVCSDAGPVLEGFPFFPSGSTSGAVVVMLGTHSTTVSHEIVVESLLGQDDLETTERNLAQLTCVRDALRKTASV